MKMKTDSKTPQQYRPMLNTKIIFLCISVCLIILCIVGGSSLQEKTYQTERSRLLNEATIGVEACGEHTRQIVNQVDVLLHAVRMTYIRTGSVTETEQFIDQLNFNTEVIENIFITRADGTFIIPSEEKAQSKSVVSRDYFQHHKTTPADLLFISGIAKGFVSGKYRFRITRRINNPDGSFGGVLIATVTPQSFTRYYKELKLGAQSLASLVGIDDKKLRARIPEPSEEKWDLPIASDSILWTSMEKADAGRFEGRSSIDNILRTCIYKKINGLPLVMVIGFSNADVQSQVAERHSWITLTEVLLVLFILIITSVSMVVLTGRDKLSAANQDLEELYSQMQKIALFDSLTGLPSRVLFSDRFHHALQSAERDGAHCILLYLDLDGFKAVNDNLGHDAGDKVLRVVSTRMQKVVRSTDTLCRWGGDEFLILLTQFESATPEIFEISQRLLAVIKQPIVFHATPCSVSASIGIALFPDNGLTFDEILKAADAAMYTAKKQGKDQMVLAEPLKTA